MASTVKFRDLAASPENYEYLCKILQQNEDIPQSDVKWTNITETIVQLTKATKIKTFRCVQVQKRLI